jgi:uncharacterized integral membrane protein
MDPWTALGIFLLGAAVGALLTAIAYSGQVRRAQGEMKILRRQDQKPPKEHDTRQGAA